MEGPDLHLRVLAGEAEHEEAFARSWGHARCHGCALEERRNETWCGSKRPQWFNGLMIVGEGPGATEARLKEPFVGRAGALLDAMLAQAGIRREHCVLSNATLCFPPFSEDDRQKGKMLDDAVARCNGRLRYEIELYKPRVILALGTHALRAVTGRWIKKEKRVPLFTDAYGNAKPCPNCNGEMTLPWWKCPECKEPNFLPPGGAFQPEYTVPPFGLDPRTNTNVEFGRCTACRTRPDLDPAHEAAPVVQKRRKRCTVCEGKKTKPGEIDVLEADYKISKVAGLVFRGLDAPDYDVMEEAARVELPVRYVVGTFHPSALMRETDSKAQKKQGGQFLVNAGLMHLRKALRLLSEDANWTLNYRVYPKDFPGVAPDVLEQHLAWMAQRAAECGVRVSLDIETDNKDPWSVTDIRCVGFHVLDRNDIPGIVVDTEGLPRTHPIVQAVGRHVQTESAKKTLQHGIYDKQVMWHIWGVEMRGWTFDTLVAHNAMHSDEPHNLAHIAGCYTDSPPWKPTKKQGGVEVWESREQLHAYNARDIYNTSLASVALDAELDRENARFVHDLDLAMYHVAQDMERVGLPVDPDRWRYWERRCLFYEQRALDMLRHYTGKDDYNPHSGSPDSAWALYDPNGPCRLVPTHYSDRTGKPSAAKDALLSYKGHPFVEMLLDFRRWNKVRTTVFGSMNLGSDWRLRTRWNVIGARTGRMSTGKGDSDDYEARGNFQNWSGKILLLWHLFETADTWDAVERGRIHRDDAPKFYLPLFERDVELVQEQVQAGYTRDVVELPGIRDLVVAPDGRRLVGADLSQAELRVLGALCGDRTLISKCKYAIEERKLEPEHDPHSYVCSFAFGDAFTSLDIGVWDAALGKYVGGDPNQKKKRKDLRDLEKRVIYGSFYGAGAETILQSIYDGGYEGPPITKEDVELILNAVWRAFPDVRPWRERTYREALESGRVWDALIGRRREFPLKKVDATVAYNFAMQATVGSMMNMAMWELRHRLPAVDPSALIIAQIHDAIYIEADEDRAEAVGRLLEECMGQELRLVEGAEFMPFPATAKWGKSWGDVS